jgi:pimeloyl-ACP methyl ester carboxylesterase
VPRVAIDGGVIHYETAGDGFPLVLLHGIGSNSRSWGRQLKGLSPRFKVIAWDAPGYGESSDPAGKPAIRFYVESLRRFFDALNLPEVVLLGHSLGGVIAQEFYRAHSDYVRRLIVADATNLGSRSRLDTRLHMIRTMSPVEIAAERGPKLLSRFAPAALVEEVVSIMSEIRPAAYEFAAIALAESDTRDVLNSLRVPTLLIWGAEDYITPPWDPTPPGATLEIIPEAGHLCYAEQPRRFNAIVREFATEP